MIGMVKKKESIMANSKAFVIIIAILFASSTLGVVFLQAPGNNGELTLPTEQINYEPFTPETEAILLQNYRVIIYASAPDDSFLFDELEMLMNSFPEVTVEDGASNFVFLVEGISETESITIRAISNETEFDTYDETEVISFICDNSHPGIASQYIVCATYDM